MGWMAHRKLKEIKQQPSMLPGPAVPGSCLASFHFRWAIHPILPVRERAHGVWVTIYNGLIMILWHVSPWRTSLQFSRAKIAPRRGKAPSRWSHFLNHAPRILPIHHEGNVAEVWYISNAELLTLSHLQRTQDHSKFGPKTGICCFLAFGPSAEHR